MKFNLKIVDYQVENYYGVTSRDASSLLFDDRLTTFASTFAGLYLILLKAELYTVIHTNLSSLSEMIYFLGLKKKRKFSLGYLTFLDQY